MRPFLILALLLVTNTAVAQEKFVGTDVDLRTVLSFKASDAAVQKMLPDGWEVSSPQAGPSKGFNLAVVFVDRQISHDPDGKPRATSRGAALVVPAKKKGTDTTGAMVVGGLFEQIDAPGAYDNFVVAQTSIERKTHTGNDNKVTIEERWQFKTPSGNSIEFDAQFTRGAATKSKVEMKVFSAAKPDYFRIYRVEQATEVVRSTSTGVDRLTKVSFKASGDKLEPLFDGSEQLISVISVPWYSRQLYLPGS